MNYCEHLKLKHIAYSLKYFRRDLVDSICVLRFSFFNLLNFDFFYKSNQIYLLKIFFLVVFFSCRNITFGQNFVNGDFEINTAGVDQINLPNATFNAFMTGCYAFGNLGNMDIITSSYFSGGPQSGNWYIGLTGEGFDSISLSLTEPLIMGQCYRISFFDKKDVSYPCFPIDIGLSTTIGSFGTLIYSTSGNAIDSVWTNRSFIFVAPINGQFITVKLQGSVQGWVHLDNFSITKGLEIDLGGDTLICGRNSILLNGGSAASYLWSNGSTDSIIEVSRPGLYWLQISNGMCTVSDSIYVEGCDLEMPNVFSPNNDGVNDFFIPFRNSENFVGSITILNRWGKKVFESNNIYEGWDGYSNGEICPDGVYFWLVSYKGMNGGIRELSGYVSLFK